MIVLAIESSCDETAVAVVEDGFRVLSSVISSQIDIHKLYGGVVPEIASRNHVERIDAVFKEALSKAGIKKSQIDAVAVTYGAGLLGALIVGVNFAKGLAMALNKPLIPVNHIHAHIAANYISTKLVPPFLCLVVSGGHTALMEVKDYTKPKAIVSTTDDAIGECFDKVARVCGLDYPGGPNVSKLAKLGNPNIKFVLKPHKSKSFSYSGLKTAVINYVHKLQQKNEKVVVEDICASFQKEAIEQIVSISISECKQRNIKKLAIAGGVSANELLRTELQKQCILNNIEFFAPNLSYCTDNAAMVGALAYFLFKNQQTSNFERNQSKIAPVSTIAL